MAKRDAIIIDSSCYIFIEKYEICNSDFVYSSLAGYKHAKNKGKTGNMNPKLFTLRPV